MALYHLVVLRARCGGRGGSGSRNRSSRGSGSGRGRGRGRVDGLSPSVIVFIFKRNRDQRHAQQALTKTISEVDGRIYSSEFKQTRSKGMTRMF